MKNVRSLIVIRRHCRVGLPQARERFGPHLANSIGTLDTNCWVFRTIVLLLSSFASIGINLPRDATNALQVPFKKSPNCTTPQLRAGVDYCQDCLGMGDLNYNAMYTIFYVCATVALALVGLMLDKFGNSVIVLTVACSFLGTSLEALGSTISQSVLFLPCMFIGAAFQGLGFMSCQTCRDCLIVSWFNGKEMGLALGVATAVNRLTALGVFCVSEKFRQAIGLQWALWIVASVVLLCLLCSVGVSIVDAYGSRQLHLTETLEQERRSLKLEDVKKFGLNYWLLVGFNATRLAVDHTMQDNLTEFVHEKFQLPLGLSAVTGGALNYIGFVSAPATGIILDVTGRPSLCLLIVAGLLPIAFFLVAFSPIHPLITIAVAGCLTCFHYVAVVAVVSQVIPRNVLGTALSTIFCFSTLCDGLLHLVTGGILGREKALPLFAKLVRWKTVMIVILAVLLVSLCFAAGNYALNCKQEPIMSAYRRLNDEEAREEEKEEEKVNN